MRRKFPKRVIILSLALSVLVGSYVFYRHMIKASQLSQQEVQVQEKKDTEKKKNYPNLANYNDLSILVSIKQQKMIIYSGNQVIFKTTVSTGDKESPTPTGKFAIEAERGEFFYNEESGEGAYYWVSFKDHGTYLFHSVPTDRYGNEIKEEAKKLGTPCSHGCVRMSKEDAKWFYESIPEGVVVSVH